MQCVGLTGAAATASYTVQNIGSRPTDLADCSAANQSESVKSELVVRNGRWLFELAWPEDLPSGSRRETRFSDLSGDV